MRFQWCRLIPTSRTQVFFLIQVVVTGCVNVFSQKGNKGWASKKTMALFCRCHCSLLDTGWIISWASLVYFNSGYCEAIFLTFNACMTMHSMFDMIPGFFITILCYFMQMGNSIHCPDEPDDHAPGMVQMFLIWMNLILVMNHVLLSVALQFNEWSSARMTSGGW